MSKTRTKKIRNYFKIFEEVYKDPTAHVSDIAVNTGLARNTVSKYLRKMYKKTIITGPSISMRPAPNYREYIYFLKFEDPLMVYNGLETFPHVLYHAVTSGDWNTMIVTDQPLDFSKLIGFQEMVHHDAKYTTETPKPEYTTWEESFHECHKTLEQYEPSIEHKNRRIASRLPWGSNEWKLFHSFQNNMRKKVSPVLRKIKVRYGAYTKWQEDLGEYCSTHTGFYPEGYSKYMHYCFLFSSNHEKSLRSIFSSFPTTSVVTELKDHLLVSAYVISSDVIRALLCIIYDMKAKRIITGFSHAVVLFHSIHNLSEK
jgi:DNA-binding Lrp family transcriptional regulator